VTRPEAEAQAFCAALTARFGARVFPIPSPLLAPRDLEPVIPDRRYAAVVFTSAQAVESSRHLIQELPKTAWCVGRKTAQAATSAGFHAQSADGDADALLEAMESSPPEGSILYLRGVDTALNLLERLHKIGIMGDEAIVYTQEARPLNPKALPLLESPQDLIIPLFSPRTARLFRDALPPHSTARLHIAAMSPAVAKALEDLPVTALTIARQPDLPAMLDAVESLLVGLTAP
jgi:uroporphyrinogen-III synthase